MTHTKTKSITSDFSNNFNSTNLKKEIENSNMTPNLIRIDRLGDSIDIIFDTELTGGDETTLNSIISGHDITVPVRYTNTINNILRQNEINDTSYKRACTFIYEGSDYINSIVKIGAIAYKSSTIDSYTILVEDKTHNTVIAESTFTNEDELMVDLTPITNIPTTRSKIEVFIKKTGGSKSQKAYVESVTFYLA